MNLFDKSATPLNFQGFAAYSISRQRELLQLTMKKKGTSWTDYNFSTIVSDSSTGYPFQKIIVRRRSKPAFCTSSTPSSSGLICNKYFGRRSIDSALMNTFYRMCAQQFRCMSILGSFSMIGCVHFNSNKNGWSISVVARWLCLDFAKENDVNNARESDKNIWVFSALECCWMFFSGRFQSWVWQNKFSVCVDRLNN